MNRTDFLLIETNYLKDKHVTVLLFLLFFSFLLTDSRLFVIEIGVNLFVDDHHGISRSTTLKVFRLKKSCGQQQRLNWLRAWQVQHYSDSQLKLIENKRLFIIRCD